MVHGFTNREEGFQLRGLVFGVISPLPHSLPLCCCHMPVWYQHVDSNTLLSVCLFICVPVYMSFLLLCASSLSVPCSLIPSVVKSIPSTYLSPSLLSYLAAAWRGTEQTGWLTTYYYLLHHCTPKQIFRGTSDIVSLLSCSSRKT